MKQKQILSYITQEKQSNNRFEKKNIKLCTYNVNSISARMKLILDWLNRRKNDLDIICLQEIKSINKNFLHKEFYKLGFTCEVFGQKKYNGVAICSKLPLKNSKMGFNDKYWDQQKRLISSKILNLHLVNIYAPRGDLRGEEKYFYKLKWYENFYQFLKKNFDVKEKILIFGDFNIARNNFDIYKSDNEKNSIGTMVEERILFGKILNLGFIDTFRFLYPEKKGYTWWNYIGGSIWKDEGMRLDYILCSKPLCKEIIDVEIDLWPRKRRNPKPSDHAPVIITLKI